MDSHEMHGWDEATRSDVLVWAVGVRDGLADRLDAARVALVDLEGRLSRGDGVSVLERRRVNLEYQSASIDFEIADGRVRTLMQRKPDSFDQGFGDWREHEQAMLAQLHSVNVLLDDLDSEV